MPLTKRDDWTKYAGNPVITATDLKAGTTMVAHPNVVFDGSVLRMFVALYDTDNKYKVWEGKSTDFLTFSGWTEKVGLSGGTYRSNHVYFPKVMYDTLESTASKKWKLFVEGYNGVSYQIGLWESADGDTWAENAASPLTVPNHGNGGLAVNRFGLHYVGVHADTNFDLRVCHSSDAINWTDWGLILRRADVVLGGTAMQWLAHVSIFFNQGILYLLFTARRVGLTDCKTYVATSGYKLGYELPWFVPPMDTVNPALEETETWGGSAVTCVNCPAMFQYGEGFKHYYQGNTADAKVRIGLATIP